MSSLHALRRVLRRSDAPAARALRRFGAFLLRGRLPLPRPALGVLRHLLAFGAGCSWLLRRLAVLLWIEPAFRSRCAVVGRRIQVDALPRFNGSPRVELGDGVTIVGPLTVETASPPGQARLLIGAGAIVGHGTVFRVDRLVEIGEGAGIAARCHVCDNDGHERDLTARVAGEPAPPSEVAAVRIGARAWLGRGCHVLKGVSIGEGAIVGAGSVVVSDVPPFCVALGHPARIVQRYGPAASAPARPSD